MRHRSLTLLQKSLVAFAIIFLPVVITFFYDYYRNTEATKRLILNNLTVLAETFEGQVYQFLEMSRRRVSDFSSDGIIRDDLQKIIEGQASMTPVLNDYLSKNKLSLDRSIHNISIISLEGKIVASTDPSMIGADFSANPIFLKGKDGVALVETAVESRNSPELVVSAPLFSRTTGRPLGVIANHLFLSEMNRILSGELNRDLGAISWRKGRGKTMEFYLINRDKLMITGSMFLKDAVLHQQVDTPPVRECLASNHEISGFYKDYRGIDVAGASMCFPALGWTLLTETDASEVLASATEMKRNAIIAATVVGGIVLTFFLLLLRNVVMPVRRLSQAVESVATGNYNITVPVETHDEIGTLSKTFNQMVVDIKDRERSIKESEEKQRELERRLGEQLRQTQKMEAIGQLAGGIAHDFNNILTALVGYGNLLKMKAGEDPKLKGYAEQVLALCDKAANLTQGLLKFSRKQILNPQVMDLNGFIRGLENVLMKVTGPDIELKTDYFSDKSLTVLVDPVQMEQVLMNLVTNAKEAMPGKGKVTIVTGLTEINDEFIKSHHYGKAGDYAFISFEDTGAGMDEATQKRIFEPFFTTKEVGKGTGLGLSIVYGIIKQHAGYIIVEGQPGVGTRFRIYLPVAEAAMNEKNLLSNYSAPKGGKEMILLAEDEMAVRGLVSTLLSEFGYKVIVASDGEDAVSQFIKNREGVHLLICDMAMSGKGGKGVSEEIRRIRPDVKVLFISEYRPDMSGVSAVIKEGFDFVLKPVAPTDLLKKVRDILDR